MQDSPFRSIPQRLILPLVLGFSLLLSSSCRRQKPPERIDIEELTVVVDPALNRNNLGGIDGMVYRVFADSPIHWQRLTPKTFEMADRAKRLVFCVVARPQHPGFFDLMRQMEGDRQMVELINSQYVPVLIDADVAREFGFLSAILCSEVNRSISFPLFLWMNKEAHPVACTPVSKAMAGDAVQIFNRSHAMIAPTWRDDLETWMATGKEGYVIKNSRHDHSTRMARALKGLKERRFSEDPRGDVQRAIRWLVAQYDDFAKDFAGSGDLVPTAALRLLSIAAMQEGLNASLRERCRTVLEAMVGNLLTTPMVDPLDGGIFSLRTGGSWLLPAFTRDTVSQIEAASALMWVHQATGMKQARETALRLLQHIESSGITQQGLFALRPELDNEAGKWMWTTAEVREILGEEDAKWWIEMTGMKDLGNLPMEMDPNRTLFRKNALRLVKTPAEMARSLSIEPVEFQERLDAARAKLLKARNLRLRSDHRDESPHLDSSFSMVSLYCQAHRLTGEDQWKRKAVELHQRCRASFLKNGVLLPHGEELAAGFASARAYHHAVALTAALDLAELAPEAVDRSSLTGFHLEELAQRFLQDGLLLECAAEDQVVKMPIEDSEMTFGDSTLGLLSILESRPAGIQAVTPESLKPLLQRLPRKAVSNPVIYTDVIEACLLHQYPAP